MASDLLNIGTSGLLAQQKMLATTSSNISNVSTQGYTRQNTVLYSNQNTLGVGDSVTRRLYSVYAQTQLWQDTAMYNQVSTTYDEASQLDKYLSNSATSLSDGIDSFFSGLQSANSSPNTTANRQDILSQVSSLASRFQSVSSDLTDQYNGINRKITTEVKDINSLIASVSDLNAQILKTPVADDDGSRANLLDQRDELIRQLSEKIDIRTVSQDNGTVQVNLSTGQSLVLVSDYAQLSVLDGDPDPRNTNIQIKLGNATTEIEGESLGSSLGGYFASRDIIDDAQKEIGQLSLAFADAMNTQNKLGMTLNNTIGGDLFTLPTSNAQAYSSNGGTGAISASVIPGSGSDITPNDLYVEFTSANTYDVYLLDGDTKTPLMSGSTPPATADVVSTSGVKYGLQLTISGSPTTNDKFLLQPTKDAAKGLNAEVTRAEDLALASPLQLNAKANNYGSAEISLVGVYNTDTTTSLFTSSGLDPAAPHKVVINSTGDYDIYDGNTPSTLIGTAAANTNGVNLLANAKLAGVNVYADPTVYPGFELSIDGSVTASDEFYIAFNTNGFSDNKNGLALASLQTSDLVRKGNSTAADNKMTFSEAFSATLTDVGTTVSSLKTSTSAADAKLTQSQELYESVAGVNLDEEASNLLRYQQAYAASAQVITTARDTFDALLSAVG